MLNMYIYIYICIMYIHNVEYISLYIQYVFLFHDSFFEEVGQKCLGALLF